MTLEELVRQARCSDVEVGVRAKLTLFEHSSRVLPDVVTFLKVMDNPQHVTAKGSEILRRVIDLAEKVEL